MPPFEFNRGGYIHQYTVTPDGIDYKSDPTKLSIKWDELKQVSQGRFHSLVFQTYTSKKLEVWLSPKDRILFLNEMLTAWHIKKPGSALKAATTLAGAKKLALLWILMTLLFPALLGGLLLIDAYHTKKCDTLLEQGKLATAKVLKVSKNRRGNFTWKMEFTNDLGEQIIEKRVAYIVDELGNPKDPNVTVVYSDEDKSCWDISLVANQKVLNVNQRNFWLIMTMSFGWVFLALATLLSAFGLYKYLEKNPYSETAVAFLEKYLDLKNP